MIKPERCQYCIRHNSSDCRNCFEVEKPVTAASVMPRVNDLLSTGETLALPYIRLCESLEEENEKMKRLCLESAGEMLAVTSKNAELEKELAEANRKLAERINDDQKYLTVPYCNAIQAADDLLEAAIEARQKIAEYHRKYQQADGKAIRQARKIEYLLKDKALLKQKLRENTDYFSGSLQNARAEIERLNQKINRDDYYITGLKQEIINNTEESEFFAKNADRYHAEKLAEKDALINQLAEALKASRRYPNTLLLTGSGNDFLPKELVMIDAAIEAAKDGEL